MTATQTPTERGLARGAAVIGGFAFVIGMGALLFGRFDPGVRFFASVGLLYVERVERFSQAERDGIRPGMVVQALNDMTLIRMPEPIYGEYDEETGEQLPATSDMRISPPSLEARVSSTS